VTGGAGFLGSFVVDELIKKGAQKKNITIPQRPKDDLRKRGVCKRLVAGKDIVVHLAAQVGGIGLNREKPGELFFNNLVMGAELMEEARKAGVEKFVNIGTICSYPKFTPTPFREKNLWMGYPEETNAPYGIAKKMLLVQAEAYNQQYDFNAINLLPVNLYGPREHFEPDRSHVIPALIRKVHEAKRNNDSSIEVWGTGKATREFLYVEDAARGIVMATQRHNKPSPVNLGSGMEISIKDLVTLICKLMDYKGKLVWDKTKPDGQPKRRLHTELAHKEFGFRAKTDFETGLKKMIDWYKKNAPAKKV